MKIKLFFILISLLHIIRSEANIDLCTFNSTIQDLPSTWIYTTVDKVKLCFQNIPVNNITMNETMKQLFNSLDFYSFFSLVRQSNYPYYTNVRFQEELLNIMNQSNRNMYTNDYDFHMSIVNTFKKLNDFHTQYNAPKGYAEFQLLLPFILEFLPLTKQIKIKTGIKLYSSMIGNNANMNYNDKIITKIDGVNALEYMKQFSEQHSLMSKDKTAKLNSVFREEFWLRNLADYPLPTANNITFTIFDNVELTLTFPYLVIVTKKFDNQSSLENDNRFTGPSSFDKRTVFTYVSNSEKLNWYQEKKNDSFDFIMGGNNIYYYTHKRTKTAIIRLASFDEENLEDVKKIFLMATGKTLIIDLIGNHGGHSCLAYSLLNYLVPEYSNLSALYEPIDARITQPLKSFSMAFNFYPNSILDLRTGLSFTNMQWIEPYVNYTRGNSTDEYSMKWSINCDGQVFGGGKFWIKNATNTKYFQSIYALTDGTCGSACSLFLSKLKFGSNFNQIFGIGGGYDGNDLFESSSYAGGGAFSWNNIVTYYNLVGVNNSSIDYLPTSAFLNLNVYEIYINSISSDYPREFVKQSIDIRLNKSDYFNIQPALEAIINYDSPGNAYVWIGSSSMKSIVSYVVVVELFLQIMK
ncbi:unnamed protein product [Rotaria sp. Silwood2]|nr:unnamed protein product [Rotaria sp. Silwood2]CAF2914961.1 unnamed protein product [Rotaria sp. Silwood2]CAF3296785.1 unnamed protein product [Rotaria sp. Silwood2]CAF3998509.1 unnamed protein product [Rotaria sp. Silwood2]CAF4024205.1 unnamed protein product [Rotaria sp. Silwood2]